MSVETVIREGLIATVEATFRADIGIDQGRICAIAEHVQGREVIDATGCVVVPGAIDVHTHFETGLGDSVTADDYESGSRAAAFGGITTYVNYAFQDEGKSLGQALDREAAKAAPKLYVDYSFHPVVTRVDADVLAVVRRAANAGMLVNVHAEDGALVEHLTARLVGEGRFEMDALPEARPDLAEALATEKLAIYGELLGCPIYFVHLSSIAALEAVRRGRARRRALRRDAVALPLPRRAAVPSARARGAQVRRLAAPAHGGRQRGAVGSSGARRDPDVRDRPHDLAARAENRPVARLREHPRRRLQRRDASSGCCTPRACAGAGSASASLSP